MENSENISWKDALKRLKNGNLNFVNDKLNGKLQFSLQRENLIKSQNPFAVILGCADSRVVPEIAFDTDLGEIFVIRVAGNVANKSTVASIEYAVVQLGVKLVVVLGHESCGAITSALKNLNYGVNLNYLMQYFKPSILDFETDKINDVAIRHAKYTAEKISEKSEIISKVLKSDVKILPAYYHLKSGKVEFF